MARTNGDDDMPSNVHNAGSKPLRWEGDLMGRGLLTRRWSLRWGGEKRVTFGLAGRGVVVAFLKVAFSLRGTTLVAKKEANCR